MIIACLLKICSLFRIVIFLIISMNIIKLLYHFIIRFFFNLFINILYLIIYSIFTFFIFFMLIISFFMSLIVSSMILIFSFLFAVMFWVSILYIESYNSFVSIFELSKEFMLNFQSRKRDEYLFWREIWLSLLCAFYDVLIERFYIYTCTKLIMQYWEKERKVSKCTHY